MIAEGKERRSGSGATRILAWLYGLGSSPLRLWLIIFAYAAAAALLVQLVVLPRWFPGWHGGAGLLVGGDWLLFHRLGTEVAARVYSEGWSTWSLRPEGQAPAGVAAVFYVLVTPEPWAVIPLNAALHATAGVTLLALLRLFVSPQRALLGTLPLVFYPSAMTWYTQLHKDGFFIAGALLLIYGWALLACKHASGSAWRSSLRAGACILAGALGVWLVRPYGVLMLQSMGAVAALALTAACIARSGRNRGAVRNTLPVVVVAWLALALSMPLLGLHMDETVAAELRWERSWWLPPFADGLLRGVAQHRANFLGVHGEATGTIDGDVVFADAREVLLYLPRAAQIALFSPFPSQWVAPGGEGAGTLLRRIAALEMLGVYAALALLPLAAWPRRHHAHFWVVLLFCFGMLLGFAVATPNIGTLYRVRYGFLMLLVGLGLAGALPGDRHGGGKIPPAVTYTP